MSTPPPFRLITVVPIAHQVHTQIVYSSHGGTRHQTSDSPVYPPSPRGAQLRRVRIGGFEGGYLSEASASIALGLTGSQLAELEGGGLTLESDAEWDRAESVLRAAQGGGR